MCGGVCRCGCGCGGGGGGNNEGEERELRERRESTEPVVEMCTFSLNE